MMLHVNTRSDGLEPAENHRAARLRRSATAIPEARAPVRSDQRSFISERTGCYGPLPVLARHGLNGGARWPTRSATRRARSARSWRASPATWGVAAPRPGGRCHGVREAPLRGGQGMRVTPVDVEPSMLSNVEDAVAWYGDTAVPRLGHLVGEGDVCFRK